MAGKVLYIQPISCEGPGIIEETRPKETQAVVIRPVIGHPIPTNAGEYAALIILGGPMGVYETEEYPWISDLLQLLRQAIDQQIPTLGICFGSQALAAAAGAVVKPTGYQEIGWYPIKLTEEGTRDSLLGDLPSPLQVFHWHGDRWELPSGAIHLASSEKCDHQAFRLGEKVYGFQCHLEISAETPPMWAEAYLEDLKKHPDVPGPQQIAEQSAQYGPLLEPWSRQLFSRFWEMTIK
jgi:GMP synthase-like glutamine amidotransferase